MMLMEAVNDSHINNPMLVISTGLKLQCSSLKDVFALPGVCPVKLVTLHHYDIIKTKDSKKKCREVLRNSKCSFLTITTYGHSGSCSANVTYTLPLEVGKRKSIL